MKKVYHIEMLSDVGWVRVPFAESRSRLFCDGWVSACDSMYPSHPMRIVCVDATGEVRVVRETKGRAAPHTNGPDVAVTDLATGKATIRKTRTVPGRPDLLEELPG